MVWIMADDSWRIRPIAHESQAAMAQLAQQILQNPLQAMQLSDRVYELLQEDLRIQQERGRGYGRRF
jgi:ABC-type glutathione transport system ATPase component